MTSSAAFEFGRTRGAFTATVNRNSSIDLFDRGRIVAYPDCGLSFKIGSRVGRNQSSLMRICDHRWMRWVRWTDVVDRIHHSAPLHEQANYALAVMDRSVTSRTVAQHIESVNIIQCLRVPFNTFYSRVVCVQVVHCLVYPLTQNHRRIRHHGAMKEGCGWQNGMKLSLLTSHTSVCNTTMFGFVSGDTVERGC
ncbi:HTH_38 domain-containing protein [Trichonephila clavipes]|nr:HTH_38 domain-containing protein [Trichonephila clavipes]